ncbi:Plasma membrane low glucose sensor [Vanrija albida]|uniref:Plasma membrane low glucose sensor n=1 Tax=Vanrija albida TaxID=181172 RepID=A0ABR3Q2M6_9TREE
MPSLAIFLGAFASFAGFLFGYDTGYISGIKVMAPFIETFGAQEHGEWVLPTATSSLVTSILSVGTLFGALFASTIADRFGRRWGIIIYIVLFCIGVALQTACKNVGGFSAGRVFAGLGVGGTSVIVPVYQAECAPKHIRGLIISAYQFFITFGLLLAAIVVYATHGRADASSYQIPIAIQFVWAAIIAIGTAVLPESPRWLVMAGKDDQGRRALSRLLGQPVDSETVTTHYAEIKANLDHERLSGSGGWLDVLKNGESRNFARIITGMGIQALQQLSGINFIIYYGTQFFQSSGITNPFVIAIAVNTVFTGMTVVGMLTFDRVGRRPLMIWGAVGMGVAQIIVAAVGVAHRNSDDLVVQKVLVAFVCIYISIFAFSWGPGGWVITAEMYPFALRAKGMSLSTSTNWLFNFGIGYATPYLVDSGPGNAGLHTNVFWIWGGCCVIAAVYSYFFVYETAQLSLEQIDILMRKSSAIKSRSYGKYILDNDLHDDEMEQYTNRPAIKFGDAEKASQEEIEGK